MRIEDHDFHHAEKILNVYSSDIRAIPYPMEAKGSLEDKITPHSTSEAKITPHSTSEYPIKATAFQD